MRPRKQAAAAERMKAAKRVKIDFKPLEKKVLLVDADIVAYQAVEDCLQEHQSADDEWTYVCDLKAAKEMVDLRLEEHTIALRCDRVVLAFGSKSNFRKRIMPEYKANRAGKRKPLGYWALVEWMSEKWLTKTAVDLEADDVIGIMATDPAFMPGFKKTVVSEDKDFNGLPCTLFNPRKPELGEIAISEAMADKFHMLQALTGDSSDGYKGCPGCGPVKAAAVLEGLTGYAQMWPAVVAAFESKGLSETDALANARVARILRKSDVNLSSGAVINWQPPPTQKRSKS